MTATTPSSRIGQLDAVRGMAILGIILMNIFAFALPQAAYLNPYYTNKTPDSEAYLWDFQCPFPRQSSRYFSILFGATLALLQPCSLRWNRCRLFVLALFGVIHGVGFWDGDILWLMH